MKSLLNEADLAAVLERIRRVQPDSARQWGRMSAHGMICHLTDAFAGVLGERPIADVSTLAGRTVMRWVALSTPIPWPKGVKTTPTPPVDFEVDRARLLGITEEFVRRLDPDAMRHPLFGRISAGEWGRWGYRHLDHHLRQFGV
jgi:hypothetical protein